MKFWKSRESGPRPGPGPAEEALSGSGEPGDAVPTGRGSVLPDPPGPAVPLVRTEYGFLWWTADTYLAGADPEFEVLGVEYRAAEPGPATGAEPGRADRVVNPNPGPEVTVFIDSDSGPGREVVVPTVYHHEAVEAVIPGLLPGERIGGTFSCPKIREPEPEPEAELG